MTGQERAAAMADNLCARIAFYTAGEGRIEDGDAFSFRLTLADVETMEAALRAFARPAPADLREAICDVLFHSDPPPIDCSDDEREAWGDRTADAVLAILPQTQAASDVQSVDYFGELVERARTVAAKASAKFPQPNYVTLKIAEEAGEVVRGAVHYAEKRMEWSEVEGEIVQLLAMLLRFVTEGDQINGVTPPERLDHPKEG